MCGTASTVSRSAGHVDRAAGETNPCAAAGYDSRLSCCPQFVQKIEMEWMQQSTVFTPATCQISRLTLQGFAISTSRLALRCVSSHQQLNAAICDVLGSSLRSIKTLEVGQETCMHTRAQCCGAKRTDGKSSGREHCATPQRT
jgi:hypothetical protein